MESSAPWGSRCFSQQSHSFKGIFVSLTCISYTRHMMKDQTTPALFMQSEAANILGLPNSLVKNWTIGRPLEINPSIAARGTGSRNLYDQRDLYRLAIA